MYFTNLNFLTIFVFLIISIIIFFLVYKFYENEKRLSQIFKNQRINKHFYLKYIFLILSFFTVFLSIFGIKSSSISSQNDIKGIDIIFVLDVSKSMNVFDIFSNNSSYNRLEFAKKAISDFITNNSENRYSLVIFAGNAISVVPLTNDKNVFLTSLENVDYRNLTTQGSNFVEAFKLANNRAVISEDKSKAVIFISDGGDEGDIVNEQELRNLKDENIKYFITGIGTEKGGKIVISQDFFGRFTYQTYNGEYVISKLNEENLKKIRDIFDGEYLKLEKYNDINSFSKYLDKIEKKIIENNNIVDGIDVSRNLVFVSFLFFVLYLGLYLKVEKEK